MCPKIPDSRTALEAVATPSEDMMVGMDACDAAGLSLGVFVAGSAPSTDEVAPDVVTLPTCCAMVAG